MSTSTTIRGWPVSPLRIAVGAAQAHLAAGWRYTTTLPWGQVRVRLACAWPVLIGLETIRKLRQTNVLDGTRRVKVSRDEVKRIMYRTILSYPFQGAWQRLASRPD